MLSFVMRKTEGTFFVNYIFSWSLASLSKIIHSSIFAKPEEELLSVQHVNMKQLESFRKNLKLFLHQMQMLNCRHPYR